MAYKVWLSTVLVDSIVSISLMNTPPALVTQSLSATCNFRLKCFSCILALALEAPVGSIKISYHNQKVYSAQEATNTPFQLANYQRMSLTTAFRPGRTWKPNPLSVLRVCAPVIASASFWNSQSTQKSQLLCRVAWCICHRSCLPRVTC